MRIAFGIVVYNVVDIILSQVVDASVTSREI